jgi:nitrogen PTS system EIIA component
VDTRIAICYLLEQKTKILDIFSRDYWWIRPVAYFDPGSIIWDLSSADKYDAIREIIHSAPIFTKHPTLDLEEFSEKVIAREKLQSTGFGHGVAVAHGRTANVDEPTIALGISRSGIDFESHDGEPVHLLFIVANHPDQQMDYLHILSTLVAMVRDELFRNELLGCEQIHDVQRKLCSVFGDLLKRSRLTACSRSA